MVLGEPIGLGASLGLVWGDGLRVGQVAFVLGLLVVVLGRVVGAEMALWVVIEMGQWVVEMGLWVVTLGLWVVIG